MSYNQCFPFDSLALEDMDNFTYNTRARRYQRYLGMALKRPLVGPTHVSLETTHHCNLRCSFCESHGILQSAPITSRREYVGKRVTMDLETIQRLALELAAVKTDLVELSGKGDPIAHPQLTQIVMALKDAGLTVALVTNGTLAKPDLAPTLVERGLDRLNVSLNSGCREVYLRSNKKDLWEKATQFIKNVMEERRRAGTQRPWVRVSHVVTKENVDDMEGMVRIPVELGVDQVDFYVMGELPKTGHLQLDTNEVATLQSGISRWARILEEGHVVHTLPTFARDLNLRPHAEVQQANPLQEKVPCYIGWNFCVIAPDGVVVPCCYCEGKTLGNINDDSFIDIWYGAQYKKFREDSLAIPKTGRWICEECFTSCNRAQENCGIYNKLHPLKQVSAADIAGLESKTDEAVHS